MTSRVSETGIFQKKFHKARNKELRRLDHELKEKQTPYRPNNLDLQSPRSVNGHKATGIQDDLAKHVDKSVLANLPASPSPNQDVGVASMCQSISQEHYWAN